MPIREQSWNQLRNKSKGMEPPGIGAFRGACARFLLSFRAAQADARSSPGNPGAADAEKAFGVLAEESSATPVLPYRVGIAAAQHLRLAMTNLWPRKKVPANGGLKRKNRSTSDISPLAHERGHVQFVVIVSRFALFPRGRRSRSGLHHRLRYLLHHLGRRFRFGRHPL